MISGNQFCIFGDKYTSKNTSRSELGEGGFRDIWGAKGDPITGLDGGWVFFQEGVRTAFLLLDNWADFVGGFIISRCGLAVPTC